MKSALSALSALSNRRHLSAVLATMLMVGLGGPTYGYEFIVYPPSQESNVRACVGDLGSARAHPDSLLFLTNKNGNVPLTASELDAAGRLLDVEIVNSDSIAAYLEENGWNEGGGE